MFENQSIREKGEREMRWVVISPLLWDFLITLIINKIRQKIASKKVSRNSIHWRNDESRINAASHQESKTQLRWICYLTDGGHVWMILRRKSFKDGLKRREVSVGRKGRKYHKLSHYYFIQIHLETH